MALVNCGRLLWPDPDRYTAFTAFSTNAVYQINGAGQRLAHVFAVPESDTYTQLGVRIHTAATPQTCRLGLYTVDASGNPTATLYGGSTAATFTPVANTYATVTPGTPVTATAGDLVALVLEFDSTAGDLFWSGMSGTTRGAGFPYLAKLSGSWAKNTFSATVAAHVLASGGRHVDLGTAPFTSAQATGSYNLNTAGADEYALRLTVPFACRVFGLWHNFTTVAGADYEAILYDGTTTIATRAWDGDVANTTTSNAIRMVPFTRPVVLAAGQTVRAAIRPTTTNNVTWRRYPIVAAGAATALGLSADACESTRVDQGAWSDVTTNLPSIGLIIDQLDDGRVSPRTRPLRSVTA